MGTKNNPGKFDCYANAEADEPMFILLGRDKHAPTLVWLWAVLRELDQEDPAKVQEARDCALAMIKWAHDHDRKAVGLAHSTIAGVFELIRVANFASEKPENAETDNDAIRMFLGRTPIADPPTAQDLSLPVYIDNDKYVWDKYAISGAEVRELARLPDDVDLFLEVPGQPREPVENRQVIDVLRHIGPPRFHSQPGDSSAG